MKEGEAEFSIKISENFSGPKQFVKLNPDDLKSQTLKYVFKSSLNMIILKLGDFKRCPAQDREELSTGKVSGLLRKGPQISINCSGVFISVLIAVLPWNEYLTLI